MQISIKPICDWTQKSALDTLQHLQWTTGLHYADFLSFHYIVYESIPCKCGTKSNYCQLRSYIQHRATSTLSFTLQLNITLLHYIIVMSELFKLEKGWKSYACLQCRLIQWARRARAQGPRASGGPQTADALIFSSREISVTNCVLFTG